MKTGSIVRLAHIRTLVVTLALILLAAAVPMAGVGASAQGADPLATRVQFLHAATDIGQVEISINGAGELDEFSYGDVSDWIDIDPGTARVTISADRAGFNWAVFDGVYPVPAGNDYYVVISDALILAGAFDTSGLPADTGRVQFTQASADTPAVSIVISGADLSIPITYPKTSDAMELPAGTYDVDIQLEETGESLSTTTGFTVEAGVSYQLVLIGDPTSTEKPIELKVLEAEAGVAAAATPAS